MIKLATASAVAFVVYSCKGKLAEEDAMDITLMPVQTADSITSVQTQNGQIQMRMEAPLMERYETDSLSTQLFPEGFAVYGYIDGGLLETPITADNARHLKYSDGRESWAARECRGEEPHKEGSHGDGHALLGPEGGENLDGLLCEDVFSRRVHAGLWDGVRPESEKFNHFPAFQQLRNRDAGQYRSQCGFGELYRSGSAKIRSFLSFQQKFVV